MNVDDREYRDPDGLAWNDLNYGQGDASFAGGAWWLIPVALVVFGIAMVWGGALT